MFCGDFHTNVYRLFNTKFSLLIYLSTSSENVHLARNLEFAGVELLLSENFTQKMVGCQPQLQHNFSPNVA